MKKYGKGLPLSAAWQGGGWPQTEEDITASGTVKLTEEDKRTFFIYLEGGTIKEPEINDGDGDADPWTWTALSCGISRISNRAGLLR